MTPDIDKRRRALEELRTADRIVAGTLGVLYDMNRARGRGWTHNGDSNHYSDAQADIGTAERELTEAQACLRRALELLELRPDAEDFVELQEWSGLVSVIVDVPQRNVERAEQVQARIRALFERVRTSDPSLRPTAALAVWLDEGYEGELAVTKAFNKPAIVGQVVFGVLVIVYMLMSILGM